MRNVIGSVSVTFVCYVSKQRINQIEQKRQKSNKNHQNHKHTHTILRNWEETHTEKTKLRKSQKLDTQTHGNNEKIKRKREITSIYKYMFVKIFFTVNMFISIDYEVMISYVKEKKEISLH